MIIDTLTIYERDLILAGFENMSVTNQNNLVSAIAVKLNCAVWQVSPTQILNHHKSIKLAMINESYEIAIAKGFTATNGHIYRLNADDRENFLGQTLRLILRPDIEEVFWKTEDAGYMNHSRADWLKVQGEAFDHKSTQIMKFNEKSTIINSATTHKQIVETNW